MKEVDMTQQEIEKLEKEIRLYNEEIIVKKQKIHECKEKIFKLKGLTEICPACWGAGKNIIGHSFRDGNIYSGICSKCMGIGRIHKDTHE